MHKHVNQLFIKYLISDKNFFIPSFCIKNHLKITNKLTKNIQQTPIQYISINSYVELTNYIIDERELQSI